MATRYFPFPPDWGSSLRYSMSFPTKVLDASTGTENRVSYSDRFVWGQSYKFMSRTLLEAREFQRFFKEMTNDTVGMPMWKEAMRVIRIDQAGTTITIDNSIDYTRKNFDVNVVMVFQDWDNYTVSLLNDFSIGQDITMWLNTAANGYVTGNNDVYVIPVRMGHIKKLPKFTEQTDEMVEATVTWIEDLSQTTGVGLWEDQATRTSTTYQSREVFTLRPDWPSVRSEYLSKLEFAELGFGKPFVVEEEDYNAQRIKMDIPLTSLEDTWNLEGFFNRVQGNMEGFFIPSYEAIGRMSINLVNAGTSLYVEDNPNWRTDFAADTQRGRYVMVYDRDGQFITKVSSVSQSGPDMQLNFSDAAPREFDMNSSSIVQLRYVRLEKPELRMSFDTDEHASVRLSVIELPHEYAAADTGESPRWLYEIREVNNPTTVYRYTSYYKNIFADSKSWTDLPITHTGYSKTPDFTEGGPSVMIMDDSLSWLNEYYGDNDPEPLEVEVREVPNGSTTSTLLFTGLVLRPEYDGAGKWKLKIGNVMNLASRKIPKLRVQRRCNWQLGDANTCRATVPSTVGTVDVVGTDYFEATEIGAKVTAEGDDQWFVGGKVILNGFSRTIFFTSGNRAYVNSIPSDLTTNDSFTAYAGCNRTKAECASKFSNLINFGGYFFKPKFNPMMEQMKIQQQDINASKK